MKIYTVIEKRHIKQMTPREREYLNNTIRSTIKENCQNDELIVSLHSLKRFRQIKSS